MSNTDKICITIILCTLMLSIAISRIDYDVVCKVPGACVIEQD